MILLIIVIILLISFIYCRVCQSPFADTRQRLTNRQITRDAEHIEDERATNRAEVQDIISANQQKRNDIRTKYQLK
jgi:hypothetical protein